MKIIPLLDIDFITKMLVQRYGGSLIFIVTLMIIVKIRKQLKCSLADLWIEMWCINTRKYYIRYFNIVGIVIKIIFYYFYR